MGNETKCFICKGDTVGYISGRTHSPPIGDYKIYLCDSCKTGIGDYREALRNEVIRQASGCKERG